MMAERRARIALALCVALFLASTTVAQAPPEEAWKPITVGDLEGYVIPNPTLKELGIPPRTMPQEQNAATYYLKAIQMLEGPSDDLDERGQADAFLKSIGDNPPDRLPAPLLEWFETTKPGRDLIRKASSLEQCQFPVIVSQPGKVLLYGVLLPNLAKMRHFARLMVFDGRVHEERDEPEKAMASYLVIFRIAAHAGQGDSLIDGLVGIACHRMGMEAIERLLATETLNPKALQRLQRELEAIGPRLPERARWVPMECAAAKQVIDLIMKNPSDLSRLGDDAPNPGVGAAAFMRSRMWRILFPDRVLKRDFDRFYDHTAKLAKLPPWQAMAQWRHKTAEERIGEEVHDWNVLAWMLLPALDRADGEYVKMQTRHAALRLNAALRRYKAARGKYPETLDALMPDYVDKLPLDPFAGKPFHYRLKDDEWTLWSVGLDLDDGGGEKTTSGIKGDGDMIWRSVVFEEEEK